LHRYLSAMKLIEWDAAARQLHLGNGRISYVIQVFENGILGQLHFGTALAAGRSYAHLGPGGFAGFSNRLDEPVRLEYPTPGSGDFRCPALTIEQADGSTVLELRYKSHRIDSGKPKLSGLPSTYVEELGEAETLEIALADEPSGVEVHLCYTIFRDLAAIARSARITNGGGKAVIVRCAMSASLDLPDSNWQLLQLSGAWARERHVVSRRLAPGRQSVASLRGASGHQHNPFVALTRAATTEEAGEAYGFSLVYSGNFLAEAEVDPFESTRLRIGVNPEAFAWTLEPNAEFQVPEAVLVFSAAGLGDLSETYHRLYRERLARGVWRDRPRPILINNWEATYFGFDEDKLVDIATVARDLGVELFVLDDGWFGARDDDTTSLGDWFVDRRKLPSGIDGLARRIEALGLRFGLWIEPEMVSPHSKLFAEHPDWAIGIPGRERTEARNQLVLDMSRREVVEYLHSVLAEVLGSAPISYVKWDMNRNLTEPYGGALPAGRQGEFFHRYMLGVYELYDRLTSTFPEILFESCAGGGGRFDPGLLAFAPQAWTSDDTDALERLKIQWGTSLCYPLSAMGAHVAAVPNHQVGRITPLATRAAVAFFGVFGYELDPTTLTDAERAEIRDQIAFYKQNRELFQRGRFLRLLSPFETEGFETAWVVVAGDARTAIAAYYRGLNRPNPGRRRLRLRGLDPSARYRVSLWPDTMGNGPFQRGGDELMRAGIETGGDRWEVAHRGDFWSQLYVLEAVP
jgi:alpha-galactosidase